MWSFIHAIRVVCSPCPTGDICGDIVHAMADNKKTPKSSKSTPAKSAGKKTPAAKKNTGKKPAPKKATGNKPAQNKPKAKTSPQKPITTKSTTTSTASATIDADIKIVLPDGETHNIDVVKTVSGVAPALLVPGLVKQEIKKSFIKKLFGWTKKR